MVPFTFTYDIDFQGFDLCKTINFGHILVTNLQNVAKFQHKVA